MITSAKGISEQRVGIIPGVAQLALDVADRTQKTTLGMLQDVRGELRVTVDSTVDFAEKTFGAVMRLTRKLTQRLDEAVAETIGNAERLLGSTVQTAREATRSATTLATTTLDGVVGHRSTASA